MNKKIRFAHLADLHLGGWREKRLTELNFSTFQKAIDKILEEKVEFVLFAGDIFNNAIPPLDLVGRVVKEFMKLKQAGIRLYVIGGSHDYSVTGKSFISLLDEAGVFVDVCKYDVIDKNKIKLKFFDDKSGARICGVLGKKNGLDKNIYTNLKTEVLSNDKFNVFMFHATLEDFKPNFMKAVKAQVDSSFLAQGFDYYAAGHVHTHIVGKIGEGLMSFPGPLFPNNFSEMKREKSCFNLCEFDFESRKVEIKRVFLDIFEKEYVKVGIDNLNPIEAKLKIDESLQDLDIEGKIVLLEISGVVEGRVSDIGLNKIVFGLYEKGAFHVLKNTYKLTSSQLQKVDVDDIEDTSTVEEMILKQSLEDLKNREIVKKLLKLDLAKQEGEKVAQHEQRVIEAIEKNL